jgi:hypothetical protein
MGPQTSAPGQFSQFDQMNAGPGLDMNPPAEAAPTESKPEEQKANSFAGFNMDSLKATSEFVPKGAVALTKE